MSNPINQVPELTEAQPPAVTRRALDTTALPWPNVGRPDFAYELHSHAGNLTVSVLHYGERQPGAETIHFRFSRPIEGCELLDTTNGKLYFNTTGTRLLLHDLFLVMVVDTYNMQVWRYPLPGRTLFLNMGWAGEAITGKTLGYGQPLADAQIFGPWAWPELEKQWQTGLGDAVNGNFFAGWPGQNQNPGKLTSVQRKRRPPRKMPGQ